MVIDITERKEMKIFSCLEKFIAAALLVLIAPGIFAHHSFTAEFDADRPITIVGTVYKVEWSNPHVWFYINVFDEETGEVSNWGVELPAPTVLQGRGWGPDSLVIGDEVKVDGFMARSGLPRVNSRGVILTATGKKPGEE